MNEFFSVILFILYYLATPSILITLYIVLEKDTSWAFRLGSITYAFTILVSIFAMNLLSSRISHSARKPMKHLFRYLTDNRLSSKQRLKTMSLIELLSGPDIGFYCLDLFPLNSFEFHLFVVNSIKLYILISSL